MENTNMREMRGVGARALRAMWMLLAALLVAMMGMPAGALADEGDAAGDPTAGATERRWITLDCLSCIDPEDEQAYVTNGKYVLLCSDNTGLIVSRYECYEITEWHNRDGVFTAEVANAPDIQGTVDEQRVLRFHFDDYDYEFQDQGRQAPIMNLSPDTWYEGLPYVVDEADLLTPEQEAQLTSRAQQIADAYGCDVHLVLLGDMLDYSLRDDIDTCTEEIAQGYKLGHGDGRDLLLLVMSMEERDYSLISHGPLGGEQVFGQAGRNAVTNAFTGPFGDNDWFAGFTAYYDAAEHALDNNAKGIPVTRPSEGAHVALSVVLSLTIGFIPALLICRFLRSRNYSVRSYNSAVLYSTLADAEITHRSERYSHTSTNKRYSPIRDDDDDDDDDRRSSGSTRSYQSSSGFGHTSGKF